MKLVKQRYDSKGIMYKIHYSKSLNEWRVRIYKWNKDIWLPLETLDYFTNDFLDAINSADMMLKNFEN